MDTLRFAFPYCRRYARSYLLGIALIPVSVAAALRIPNLTGEAVNSLDPEGTFHGDLWMIVQGVLIATVVRGVTLYAYRNLIIGASRHAEFDLRNELFAHLESLDQLFFKRAQTGDLMARLSSDVDRARLLFGPVIMYSVNTAFMLAFALPLMFSISWILTVLVMIPLCLMTIAVRAIGPHVHHHMLNAQETLSALSSHAQEDFAGVRVVKSFAQEESEIRGFEVASRRYHDDSLEAAKYTALMQPIIGGIGDLALISVLLVSGWLILSSELELREQVKFIGYQMTLLWPMLAVGWVVNQYQRARASVQRVRSLLAERAAVTSAPGIEPRERRIEGQVTIRNLDFDFGGVPVLTDVSLEIPRGQTIAIVGRTGSGKSTLVSLLPRIYPVPEGTIFVDGIDVNDLPLDQLRRSIGFVPQENFLFSRTIGENIALGAEDADAEEIHTVAGIARIDKDFDQFPHGYDEIVGERGVTLSGGQRQRAAVARALLIKPKILILDDALSAVDTETESEIVSGLKRFTSDLTTIVVSHRISSIQHADRIYVLDEGRIVESGTHATLLALGGIYTEIHRLQLISDELESM